jgi:hypothetical protein
MTSECRDFERFIRSSSRSVILLFGHNIWFPSNDC